MFYILHNDFAHFVNGQWEVIGQAEFEAILDGKTYERIELDDETSVYTLANGEKLTSKSYFEEVDE